MRQAQPWFVLKIRENGADSYSFEVSWRSGPGPGEADGEDDRFRGGDRRDGDRFRDGGRFSADQAVQACQAAVRDQAAQRFRTGDINFRQTAIDDQPGRADWVVGTLELVTRGRQTRF